MIEHSLKHLLILIQLRVGTITPGLKVHVGSVIVTIGLNFSTSTENIKNQSQSDFLRFHQMILPIARSIAAKILSPKFQFCSIHLISRILFQD